VDQHVISAWHLRAFARRFGGIPTLHVYDKEIGSYGSVSVRSFLAEVDAHSPEVELGLSKIEARAAEAARRLTKAARQRPAGLYALGDPSRGVRTSGEPLADKGVVSGMRLLVSEHELPSPSLADRLALATYAGLMYQRAPKVEAAMIRFGIEYQGATTAALEQLAPGFNFDIGDNASKRRDRMQKTAAKIGLQLSTANWWVARSSPDEPFVLGDNPVATTISLGHDDSWRPILGAATYVVALPLGPDAALVVAPQVFIPLSNAHTVTAVNRAINRLIWRSAARYVVASSRSELEAAVPGMLEDEMRSTIPVDHDEQGTVESAFANTIRIMTDTNFRLQSQLWQRWVGCRLTFGLLLFPAEDRHLFVPPFPPACTV
jgi:hypothetical protein